MLRDVAADFRLALRSLRLRPGFSALVVATLALGVGATTAVFGIADEVLLRPLPGIRDPRGAAYLQLGRAEDPTQPVGIAALDFVEMREAATTLEAMAAYGRMSRLVSLQEGDRPTQVVANYIHGDFFELLGVQPLRGRLLTADETDLDDDPAVAVISEALWTTLLGRSEDVVGRTLYVQGVPFTVVGVAGGGFEGVERGDPTDMWFPVSVSQSDPERIRSRQSVGHGSSGGGFLIRPRPGVSSEDVEADIARVLQQVAAGSEVSRERLLSLTPYVFPSLQSIPLVRERTAAVLRTLALIAALILLIACANVANLMLFRGLGRRGDVAVRRALGASGGRVARQELVGGLVLSVLGGAAGLLVAWATALLFRGDRLLFRSEPFQGMTLDARVFAFVGGAVVLTTLLAGVLPAWLAGRVRLTESMRETGGRNTRGRGFLRSAVSSAQLALSVPLLVGALLLSRSVQNLYDVDLGMDPEGVIAFTWSGPGRQPLERQVQLLESLRAVPGVETAAIDYPGAFYSGLIGRARLTTAPEDELSDVSLFYVSPGWFELMEMRPSVGRPFGPQDDVVGAPPTVLITAPLAQRLFGRTDVVGQKVVTGFGQPVTAEIVGVLENVRMGGPNSDPTEALFLPYQNRPALGEVSLMLRTRGFDAGLAEAIREAASTAFPELPVPDAPALLTSRIDRQLSEQRVLADLLGLVAGLGVLLSGIGLYGVVAIAVAARKRELGIRLALGSPSGRIAGLVMRHAGSIVIAGLSVGLLGAYWLSRALESRLYEVTRGDPGTYGVGALLLGIAAAAAALVPTWSAIRTDPAVTLREE